MKLITLKFTSPFKIGEKENYIDAITLYRAFIKALTLLNESFDEIREGKVKFSSIFPIVNGNLYIKMPFRTVKCEDRSKEKELKKIEYLNVEVLRKASPPYKLECRGDEKHIIGYDGRDVLLDSNYLTSYGETIVEYKNRIDRINNSSDIYTSASFMPKYEVGFLTTEFNSKLERALRLLEKLGLGKDRNLGYGKFVVTSIRDYELSLPSNREYKYVTGKAYTEGDFIAERLERVQIIGGDVNPVLLPELILLPWGSLVKDSQRLYLERNKNVVIVDPILL